MYHVNTSRPVYVYKLLLVSVGVIVISCPILKALDISRHLRSLIHSKSSLSDPGGASAPQYDHSEIDKGLVDVSSADLNILSRARSVKKPKGYEEIIRKAKEMDKLPQEMEETDRRVNSNSFLGRGLIKDPNKRWKYAMYVIIDKEMTDEERDWTTAAIYTLKEAMKCFDFKIVPSGTLSSDVDHIHIKLEDSKIKASCGTTLGRHGGKQIVAIGRTCNNRYGVTMHEVMHTLGFFHEHVRTDRNKYVKVYWSEVPKSRKPQFKIRKNQIEFEKYDFESVLHYPFNRFMGPKGGVPHDITVGQRNHLSPMDIQRLQKAYPCTT